MNAKENTNLCWEKPLQETTPRLEGAILKKATWNKTTLHVCFLGGSKLQQEATKRAASEWESCCSIKFLWISDASTSDIRIAFSDAGCWSVIGIMALTIPKDKPTMNLCRTDFHIVLHEFGHAIGFVHEHSVAHAKISWNRGKVIEEMKRQNWTEEMIEANIFQRYSSNSINGTTYDETSIMHYELPAHWLKDGNQIPQNTKLSTLDKKMALETYPHPNSVFHYAITSAVTAGAIGAAWTLYHYLNKYSKKFDHQLLSEFEIH